MLSQEESNLHNQNQNLVHYHYAMGQTQSKIDFGTAKIYNICKSANLFCKNVANTINLHFQMKNQMMKSFRLIFFLVIGLAISLHGMSQGETSNIQLASKYYQNGEYEKAQTLYEDLYAQTDYKSYRDMYLSCLNLLHQYDAAEKFLKKEIKKKKNDLYLYIDLGYIYYSTNRITESNEQFEKAKDLALANETMVANASNAFQYYRQYQQCINLYEKASKKFNKKFEIEIGNIFGKEKNYEQMMKHYLDVLTSETIDDIEAKLTTILANDNDDSAVATIERMLAEQAQKKPNSGSLNNLTIWLYTQTGRNNLALKQIIAYNKRIANINDKEILEFGNSMMEIEDFDNAIEAFEYLTNKSPKSVYQNEAYVGYLDVKYKITVASLNPDRTKLEELDAQMTKAIKELAIKNAYNVIISSAQLKAYYLGKYEEAIEVINDAISTNYYKDKNQDLKLLLGDIYLLNNNPWDATLLYAQIEKSNAGTEIVNEARFRKAKLAYYIGQFSWAQAQLDVLKAGTSRLISNDALELSLFIKENYDMDTTETTMQTFARADFYTFSKQYSKALKCLDTITEKYPSHSLSDDVLYRKAQIYEQTNDLEQAASLYEKVFNNYKYDVLADNALYRYAMICERQNKTEAAKDAYFKLISEYSGSIFTIEARKKLRNLSNASSN